MGLTLDEPKPNDERIEVEGFPFIVASEVADMIRSYGKLLIDYQGPFLGEGVSVVLSGKRLLLIVW